MVSVPIHAKFTGTIMKIILVRHGEAEDASLETTDQKRALTAKGIDDIHKIGAFVRNSHIKIKEIYHSPYQRTKHTAHILAEELNMSPESIFSAESLSAGSDCSNVLPKLNYCTNSDAIIVVAHNPDITIFAAKLLGDSHFTENLHFSPGTTIALNVAKEKFCKGQILWAISPDFLASSQPLSV